MATNIVGSKMPTLASVQLKPSFDGLGQNGYGGPSSLFPGQSAQCDLKVTPKTDAALDRVKAAGSATVKPVNEVDLSQEMARGAVRPHPYMKNPNAGNVTAIPGKLADSEREQVRKPE